MEKHCYLELREGDQVVRRQPTSLASEAKDRRMMERYHLRPGGEIYLIVSPEPEKVID